MNHRRCPTWIFFAASTIAATAVTVAPPPPSILPDRGAPTPPPATVIRPDTQPRIAGRIAVAEDGAQRVGDGGCDDKVAADSLSECAPLWRVGPTERQTEGSSPSSSRPRWSVCLSPVLPPPTRPPPTLLLPLTLVLIVVVVVRLQ